VRTSSKTPCRTSCDLLNACTVAGRHVESTGFCGQDRPSVCTSASHGRGCYPGNPGTTSRVAESRSARSDCLRTRAYKFPASASRRRVIEDSLRRPLSSDTALSGSYLSTTGMLSSPAVTVLTIHGSSRTGSAAATAIMMGPSGCQVCQWGLEGSAAPNLQYSEYKIQAWRHVYVCIRVFVYTTASVTSATPRADTRFYRRSCFRLLVEKGQ
jgi:hypothetical protein